MIRRILASLGARGGARRGARKPAEPRPDWIRSSVNLQTATDPDLLAHAPLAHAPLAHDSLAHDLLADVLRERREERTWHRAEHLVPGSACASGEVWHGPEAKRLGRIDKVAALEVIGEQHPDAELFEFGPPRPGARFLSTSLGSWCSTALGDTLKIAVHVAPEVR